MFDVFLRLLPQRRADAILTFLRRVNIANPESRAVRVETDHIHFAGNINRRFEAMGLGDEQIRRIAAITGALHAEPFRVGDAQALPVADRCKDVIVSGLVLNFVPDRAKALHELQRVARARRPRTTRTAPRSAPGTRAPRSPPASDSRAQCELGNREPETDCVAGKKPALLSLLARPARFARYTDQTKLVSWSTVLRVLILSILLLPLVGTDV